MRFAAPIAATLLAACAASKPADPAPAPAPSRPAGALPARPDLDRRIARLELGLLERDAQVDDLQERLDAAREEVVRAMAKLQTLASRADAASGMAEAEVALQPLKAKPGPSAQEAGRLLQQSAQEFDQSNYGGALYLANQAKALAKAGGTRLSGGERGSPRPGETPFALPISLKSAASGNVRNAPGTDAPIAFSVAAGAALTGYSYLNDWIRVGDIQGREGWIFRSLVVRP